MNERGGWRAGLLLLITILFAIAAIAVPAVPQPQSYHQFADCRAFLGIENFFNVMSNLPFFAAGAWGLSVVLRGEGQFVDARERLPYLVFFLGALLTCAGSAWYHWAPDNTRLVWDRLPMTLGFAGLVAAAVVERVDSRLGLRSLWPLLALGIFTVMYWHGTERAGAGNLVPYAAYQTWSIVVIVVLLLMFPARHYSHGHLLAWAAGWYGLAKVFETFDLKVYQLTAAAMSGHTIKHLVASIAVFAIVWQLRRREAASMQPPRSCPSIPAA